ncbi:nucleotidyltransferase family protein [Desertibaculum subflavum]|uniref:nucleotidyltransferase family protein n=1 Tax=Desertibaculum subflavum TaxID=2268458 RepID=UPI000E66D4D8
MSGPIPALILAGSRGPDDPLALATGTEHKAFIEIGGQPMLARVVAALSQVPAVGRITIAIERPELVEAATSLAHWRAEGRLSVMRAADSPAATVARALEQIDGAPPLFVTTADHALLTPQMVRHFLDHAPAEADVAAGIATDHTIQAAYPGTRRTYLRFRGIAFSGCNLFLFRSERARHVADLWREVERHRKRPWRMIAMLGIGNLTRFLLGRLTLPDALARLSTRTGARLAAVDMPFAEAAIDVDKPADLELVRGIVERSVSPSRP